MNPFFFNFSPIDFPSVTNEILGALFFGGVFFFSDRITFDHKWIILKKLFQPKTLRLLFSWYVFHIYFLNLSEDHESRSVITR